MIQSPPSRPASVDAGLANLIDELTAKFQAGEPLDLEHYAAAHPEYGERLRELWPALHLMADLGLATAATGSGEPAPGYLGDYRIIREVGRGGMGVVYEAEQLSLGRRVALKVLPFAATMDPRHLRRFQNEARAAASLHHEHIVPVYGVGCERSVHFYAMQFIDGRPLSELIAHLGRVQDSPADPAAGTDPAARAVTLPDFGAPAYWRRVAELGAHAAEALEYAHSMGVVHRDVKPGNLLLDGDGKLWVADFGLAKFGADAGVTMTGDLLGTLRYMSPEQALAKHGLVDHRTDVYSLGVTLYELLMLEPAFGAGDRQELLRQIAFDEPRPRFRAVPEELTTVVRKAMAKDPVERYPTAKELADDLRRFLNDEPIKARRPTVLQRARRWGRLHRSAVRWAAATVIVAVAVLAGSVGWVLRDRNARQAKAVEALDEAARFEEEGKWAEVRLALSRAEALLEAGDAPEPARQRARGLRNDLTMVHKLEAARLAGARSKAGRFDLEGSAIRYAEAFREYGIDVEAMDPADAGRRISAFVIRVELAAALDRWAELRRRRPADDGKSWKDLLAVARVADPDPWRNQVRRAWERDDRQALLAMAVSDWAPGQPAPTLALLGSALGVVGEAGPAVDVLRKAQRRFPDDFWINYELACHLRWTQPPLWDETIRFHTAAVALRPGSSGAHYELACVFHDTGRLDEAIDALQTAIRLNPDYPEAHEELAISLWEKGRREQSIAEHNQAIRLRPDYLIARYNLGIALRETGRTDEAIALCRETIHLRPDHVDSHVTLANALADQRRVDEAIAEFQAAIRLEPNHAVAHKCFAYAWRLKGRPDRVIAEYEEALRCQPDYAAARNSFAWFLATYPDGKFRDPRRAVELAKRAVQLVPKDGNYWNTLGVAHYRSGDWETAVAALETAVQLSPGGDSCDWFFLAMAHSRQGNTELARCCYDQAVLDMRNDVRHCDPAELNRFRAEAEETLGLRPK